MYASSSCKRLGEHFSSGACKNSNYVVQIVEKLKGNGRKNNMLDPEITKERKKREDQWMIKLRTVYPYGLNDSLNDQSSMKVVDTTGITALLFSPLPRTLSRPPRVHNHNNNTTQDSDSFFTKFFDLLANNRGHAANFLRRGLLRMNKMNLTILAKRFSSELCKDVNEKYVQWLKMGIDIMESKMYKVPRARPEKKHSKYKITIPFVNKALDFINVPQVLRSKETLASTPPLIEPDDIPMVVFKLSKPIRSQIFNYKKFVSKELDLDKFGKNKRSITCNCRKYDREFWNTDRNHVLTGNLEIVKNAKLRKLLSKGPKFREPTKINWKEARTIVSVGLDNYVEIMSKVKGVSKVYFDDWKNTILSQVDEKINTNKQRVKAVDRKSVFEDPDAKQELDSLQSDFIIVPIDKASSNIAFICRRHYAEVIYNELDIASAQNPNSTYGITNTSSADIILSHRTKLSNWDLELEEEMQCLPNLYWIPKMHKTPVGERFIIASPKCSTKPLLKDATNILSLCQHNIENFHNKNRIWTGISNFWVIQNNSPVTDRITKINKNKKGNSIRTFDFSTLYTKIPHILLLNALYEIVDFCFKGGISYGIYVNSKNNGASWRKPYKDYRLYSKESIKEILKFIVDNAYFQIGDKVFKQCIGIPMGSDPAPFMANLFLYFYENNFMEYLKKNDPERAKKFRHVLRFIDDLIAMNDQDEFSKSFREIYPQEMEVKEENTDNKSASYLDLDCQIKDKTIVSKLFDKRDAFKKFSIVRMPYRCSNIPSKMFYSTISAEILRICRACSLYSDFLSSSKKLLTRMENQGAKKEGTGRILMKMLSRHSNNFTKFAKAAETIVSDILVS